MLFFDEIDGLAGKRGGPGYESTNRILNQLIKWAGLEINHGVLILAATNRKDLIDEALLRPGRFDYQIEIPLPDASGREAIFRVHLRDKPFVSDVDICALAAGTHRVLRENHRDRRSVSACGALCITQCATSTPIMSAFAQADLITALAIGSSTRPVHRSIGFTVS